MSQITVKFVCTRMNKASVTCTNNCLNQTNEIVAATNLVRNICGDRCTFEIINRNKSYKMRINKMNLLHDL